jgi:hypothetical protein
MPRPASPPVRSPRLVLAVLVVACVAALLPGASATAAPSKGAIQPGVRTYTDGAQCTANFVFVDRRTQARYLGQSAHCASNESDSTATNGCAARSLPLGTPVRIEGATKPGRLVYSSWETMGRVRERDRDACAFNDFALVLIDPADHRRVNPTVPVFGGPTGLAPYSHRGDRHFSYGNSSLRPVNTLDAKRGTSQGTTNRGWATRITTTTSPGIPGDSGSGFLDSRGRAVGVLSTLNLFPGPGSNTLVNLAKAIEYAERHSDLRLHLPTGWNRFSP